MTKRYHCSYSAKLTNYGYCYQIHGPFYQNQCTLLLQNHLIPVFSKLIHRNFAYLDFVYKSPNTPIPSFTMTRINNTEELKQIVKDGGLSLQRIANIEEFRTNKSDECNTVYLLDSKDRSNSTTVVLIHNGCTRSIRWGNTNKVSIQKWLRGNGQLECAICYENKGDASMCPVCGSETCILCLVKSLLTDKNVIGIFLFRQYVFNHRCSECRCKIIIDVRPLLSRAMKQWGSFTQSQQQALEYLRQKHLELRGRTTNGTCSGSLQAGDMVIIGGPQNSEHHNKMGIIIGIHTSVDGERSWPIRLSESGETVRIRECRLLNVNGSFSDRDIIHGTNVNAS